MNWFCKSPTTIILLLMWRSDDKLIIERARKYQEKKSDIFPSKLNAINGDFGFNIRRKDGGVLLAQEDIKNNFKNTKKQTE